MLHAVRKAAVALLVHFKRVAEKVGLWTNQVVACGGCCRCRCRSYRLTLVPFWRLLKLSVIEAFETQICLWDGIVLFFAPVYHIIPLQVYDVIRCIGINAH